MWSNTNSAAFFLAERLCVEYELTIYLFVLNFLFCCFCILLWSCWCVVYASIGVIVQFYSLLLSFRHGQCLQIRGSFLKILKKGESMKKFFLSFRAFFRMFLNSLEVLAKNFHEKCMFFTKNSRRVRFWLIWKISQNHQNWTLFKNEKFFWKWILNVPWGLFPHGG